MSSYPIKHLVLSHSTRGTFRRCARLLEFKQFYGDNTDREDSFVAEVGKALHAGFQEFMITRDEKRGAFAMALAYPYHLEYVKAENSTRSFEAAYSTLLALMASHHWERYELVQIRTRSGEIKHAVEVPFALKLITNAISIPVYFVGFIDLVLYDKQDRRYLVTDIKSTRISVSDYSARYEFDEQTVPYALVLEHALGKEIQELDVAYLSAYVDILLPKVAMYNFKKTREHVIDWGRGLKDDVERIGKYYKEEWFPRATDGSTCFSFNKACFFAGECSYRDPKVLSRVINGTPRDGFFSTGAEPWIYAEIEI